MRAASFGVFLPVRVRGPQREQPEPSGETFEGAAGGLGFARARLAHDSLLRRDALLLQSERPSKDRYDVVEAGFRASLDEVGSWTWERASKCFRPCPDALFESVPQRKGRRRWPLQGVPEDRSGWVQIRSLESVRLKNCQQRLRRQNIFLRNINATR